MKRKTLLTTICLLLILLAGLFIFGSKIGDSKDIQAMIEKGDDYLEDKDYEKAIEMYKQVLDIDGRHVEVMENIADAYVWIDDLDQGIHFYEKALNLDDMNVDTYIDLSLLYFEKKLYHEGKEIIEEGILKTQDQRLEIFLLGFLPRPPRVDQTTDLYEKPFDLEIRAEDNYTIYYTLDGSDVSPESQVYSQPIRIEENCKIRIRTMDEKGWMSPEVTYDYIIKNKRVDHTIYPESPKKELIFIDQGFETYIRNLFEIGQRPLLWEDVAYIEVLDFEDLEIESLEDLKWFVNLRKVNTEFSGNVNGDLKDLASLTRLETISFVDKGIYGDIHHLSDLKNLKSIFLWNKDITGDIGALKNLDKLYNLNLNGTQVSGDIGQLKELTGLRSLIFINTPISGDLSQLDKLENLEVAYFLNTELRGQLTLKNGEVIVSE